MWPPSRANSMRPRWVKPRFPPSPTTRHRSAAGVDPDGVVVLVADVGVRLGRRLDVGADPAVPEQVHRRPEDRADELVRRERLRVDVEGPAHLVRQRHGLGRPGEHPAARRDRGGVVVRPGRARQREQPRALVETARGIGVRVEEDVPVVEGGDQSDVPGQQHAVAEHVTGHVPDARHGEVLVLHVDAEGPEVPPDRHPGAASGDPHGLVVVALRPAGGEGVPEPERVLPGDLVGHVGERRGPLVGGDDEVGVVPVVAHDAMRRHDPAVDQVVGDVEQAPHERAVAGRDLGVQRVPARGWRLHDEPALGADRHDDGVLDGLGLRQPEYLGAEVLRTVGPAQPAAGDRTAPQVHALDARGIDEDLEHRPRQGQVRDAARIELQREPGDPSRHGLWK